MEVHVRRGTKWQKKCCTEVITQLHDFRNRNDSARGKFAPSIHPCYDLHFSHTSGCQQAAWTLWCHKTVIRLVLNWISYQTRIPFVSIKNPESEPWKWVGESIITAVAFAWLCCHVIPVRGQGHVHEPIITVIIISHRWFWQWHTTCSITCFLDCVHHLVV
jgi:hypothetical protein